jgi:hypothetical protein
MRRSRAQEILRERAVRRCLRRGRVTRGPYVPSDSLTDEWRYHVEGIVEGKWLRVVVELPDEPPNVIVVTVIVPE